MNHDSPLLLLHPLGARGGYWAELAAGFPERQVVTPDLARVSHGNGGLSIERMALEAVAGTTERVDVVGLSMGGCVAIQIAAARPELVRRLVIAGSYAVAPEPARALAAQLPALLERIPMSEYAGQYVAGTLAEDAAAHRRVALERQIASTSREDYLACVRAIMSFDGRPLLAQITAETLVLVGERDQRAPTSCAQELVEGIPAARLQVIPKAGHLADIDRPDAFLAAVKSFLESDERA